MSGFSSLNVGTQALFAAQRALDVVGQNVSNANTDGYSRQRVQQVSRGGSPVPAIWSTTDGASGGVDVTGTQRIRDGFLELRAQQEHATGAGLDAMTKTYADLEATFGEPSTTGLAAGLSSFWASWQDVANNPGDSGPASLMLEQATTLARTAGGFAGALADQWEATRSDVDSGVAQVNSMTSEVARLNRAIRSATLSGQSPNELADQRDVLVLKIAEATGAVAAPGDNGTVNLTLAGRPLVMDDSAQALKAVGPTDYPATTGTVSFVWTSTGQPAAVTGGTLDGQATALNATIPGFMSDLDTVVSTLATTVNTQQAAGFDHTGSPGGPIFAGTTAATLSVVLTDPEGVATSSQAPPTFNGDNALAMGAHASDATGADTQYQDLMVKLGVQSQTVQRHQATQQAVVSRIDNARDNVAGVSVDEEMTNLVNYQHAYSAAAKYISAINDTLDTLINMTR